MLQLNAEPGKKFQVHARLDQLGIVLPKPWRLPEGVATSAEFTRIQGKRMIISGHVPLDVRGQVCGPYGKVGDDVSLAEAVVASQRCALAMLASVNAAIGSLDAIAAWMVVRGYINNSASFNEFPKIMNGCSDLLLSLFGSDAGRHARVAIGVSGLPFNVPVEIEAELMLR